MTEPRIILQIRVSRRWVEGSLQIESLAHYLYSLYEFLGLADPTAIFGWAIAQDNQSGAPYLILIENPTAGHSEKAKPVQVKVPIKDQKDIEGSSDSALSPDELIPDL